jgi:hypothetical protein
VDFVLQPHVLEPLGAKTDGSQFLDPDGKTSSLIASQRQSAAIGFLCPSFEKPSVVRMRNDDLSITASVTSDFVLEDCQLRNAAQFWGLS